MPPAYWTRRRSYTHKGKPRLNVPAAAKLLGMKPDTFYRWQRRGWPQWDWKPLPSRPLPVPNSPWPDGQEEETFLRADVLELRKRRHKDAKTGVYRTRLGFRYNRGAVLRNLQVGPGRLAELEADGTLNPVPGKSPVTGKKETHYLPDEVEAAAALVSSTREDEMMRQDEATGKSIILQRGAFVRERLGVGQQTLAAWGERCPHLKNGAAFTPVEEYGPSGQFEKWYPKEQADQIQQSLCRQKAGSTGRVSKKQRKLRQRQAKKSGRYLIDGESYLSHTAAERDHGICYRDLQQLVAAKLARTATVPSTAGRGTEKTVYHEDDLKAHRGKMSEAFDGEYPTPGGAAWNLARISGETGCSRGFFVGQMEHSDFHPAGHLPHEKRTRPVSAGRRSGRGEETVLVKDLAELALVMHKAMDAGTLDHRSRLTAVALGEWLDGISPPGGVPPGAPSATRSETVRDYGGISAPPKADKMVLSATRTYDITPDASDKIARRVKEVLAEAEHDEDGYIAATAAHHATGVLLPQLSKLCHDGGPIRFKRNGQRLKIHAADLLRYLFERDQQEE